MRFKNEQSGHDGRFVRLKRAFLLSSGNGVNRAGICACAAVGAGVRINNENIVALTDGFHRAGGFACAAGNAFA